MSMDTLSIRVDYWESFQILPSDLEFIYNHLLELETPRTSRELLKALISERIRQEIENLKDQQASGGTVYLPKNQYLVGQQISFANLDWNSGSVKSIRPGNNPEMPPFQVIDVQFKDGENKLFAASLENHKLNEPVEIKLDDPLLNEGFILKKYGDLLASRLTNFLQTVPELVRIAGKWFPRALLVDVNMGHLNLAEAVLEMANGGPLSTQAILEQIDLPTDVNNKLTEFSLNLSLQEDGRFDEIGPSGEILWFLRRLEPDGVREVPIYLKFNPVEINDENITDLRTSIQGDVIDELENEDISKDELDHLTISLIFPHWRCGTLPLSNRVSKLLPTAYESPRVQFVFVDRDTNQKISAWVVRSSRYVYGLLDWYQANGLFPGCLVNIQKSKNPGEVIIWAEKRRSKREWIRTTLIGADGGMVFATLKQIVSTPYDERMAIAISDLNALDLLWENLPKQRMSLEQTVHKILLDLAKLNPQGHVHVIELYAAVNLIRRCPPSVILNILSENAWSNYQGDLYFKPGETSQEGNSQ